MSLLPHMFGYYERPLDKLIDQNFGLGIVPDDILIIQPVRSRQSKNYLRPWRQMQNSIRDLGSSIKADKDKFQVNLDVQHFAPEEINVKVANGHLVVEGKHEEKQDEHGFISRQFVRRYDLPENCNMEAIESKLSSDGVLSIVAPRKCEQLPGEKKIPITHTGPVRKEVKDSNEVHQKEALKKS